MPCINNWENRSLWDAKQNVEKAIQFISKYASLDIIDTNYLQKGVVMTAVSPPVETPRVCKWADNIGKSPQRIRKVQESTLRKVERNAAFVNLVDRLFQNISILYLAFIALSLSLKCPREWDGWIWGPPPPMTEQIGFHSVISHRVFGTCGPPPPIQKMGSQLAKSGCSEKAYFHKILLLKTNYWQGDEVPLTVQKQYSPNKNYNVKIELWWSRQQP